MVIRTICYHHMKRHIGPWNRIESPWNKHTHIWSIQKKSVLNIHWKDWCWSWNSNTLATWCKELTHWKRPWCWERLKVGGEGENRGWDGWMTSLTQWIWIWASSGSWWWTGKPDQLQSMGSQTVGQLCVISLNIWQHVQWGRLSDSSLWNYFLCNMRISSISC